MAEFERVLIRERVKAGLRHARSNGKRLGRPTIVGLALRLTPDRQKHPVTIQLERSREREMGFPPFQPDRSATLKNRERLSLGTLPVRVLVVEDFESFRRVIRSMLGKRLELQGICEVSDGLEAVQKAGELQPDLILLDIGLPTVNGIEVARRIRKVAPQSRILFLTQESSADVVQEALSLGAAGYVLKVRAGSELLAAVEAVLQGKQFVSSGLAGQTQS
jgi:CheY-like chemotaxis protein